jgi:GT2 family glycosyltransferase
MKVNSGADPMGTGSASHRSESRPLEVAIVIVAYNSPSRLARCVASIHRDAYPGIGIFIVDNSTKRFSPSEIPQGAGIRYHRTGSNLGFCTGCNLGIAMARERGAEFILFLNHDTEVEPGAIAALVRRARALPRAGIVGPKIRYLDHPDILWFAGGTITLSMGVGHHYGFNERDEGRHDVGREVGYVTGCCMLIPERVLAAAGPLKDELFMYLDDTEFCLRIRSLGYTLYYEPAAVIYHEAGPGLERHGYPDYYLYFSIRNKPHISRNPAYRGYLHAYTFFLAAAKLAMYGLRPGVPERGAKLRAILYGFLDSFSLSPRYRRRFPRLFTGDGGAQG